MRLLTLLLCLPTFIPAQYQFKGKIDENEVTLKIVVDLENWEKNSAETMGNAMQGYTDYLIESNKIYYLQSISSEPPAYDAEKGGMTGDMITCSFSPFEVEKINLPLQMTSVYTSQTTNPANPTFYCMLSRYYVENGVQGYTFYGNPNLTGNASLTQSLDLQIDSFHAGHITGKLNGSLYKMSVVDGQFKMQEGQTIEIENLQFTSHLYPLRLKWKPRGMTAKTTSELMANYISPAQIQAWRDEPLSQYEHRLIGNWQTDAQTCGNTEEINFSTNKRYDQNGSEIRKLWRLEKGSEALQIYAQSSEMYNFDTQQIERWWQLLDTKNLNLLDFPNRKIKCEQHRIYPVPIYMPEKAD